jgi:O-antigen/teichoic acid export membrane protein
MPQPSAKPVTRWGIAMGWKRVREIAALQFQSSIGRNATWMLSGQGVQLAAQFVYFVIIAHVLGPRGYGTFVACTALVLTMSPFSPWGTGHLMVKYAVRDPKVLPIYFGNALLVTAGSGLILILLALLIRPFVLPPSVSARMVVAIGLAELICTQVTTVCSLAFQALERLRRSAQMLVLSAGLRLIAAVVLASTTATPMRWAYLYSTAALVSACAGVIEVSCCFGRPRVRFSMLVPSVREGFHFATVEAAQMVYTSIDKTMLARLSSVEAAAIYAIAYRFIEAAMLPIRSLAAAAYPEFFRRGVDGVTSAYQFARQILRRSVAYGIVVTIALFLASGLIPLIMGAAYAESSAALRWLCILPVIKGVHAFLTDTLTGANYQWQRSLTQMLVAVFNVIINLWLIRAFSWRGAAWSSVLTDVLLMLALYLIIRWHVRREARTVSPPQTAVLIEGA